jgi:predicted ribosomally synthesized peptide with SipW-like signal peptide
VLHLVPGVLTVLVSLVAVSAVVVRSSFAAFSDTVSNSGNTFSAGTVDLVDNDLGAVMFNAAGLIPGQSVTNCIVVTYQGTVTDPARVKIYSGGFTDSATLAPYLQLGIEEGTGGTFGDCTGFSVQNTIESGATLANFDSTHSSYASGDGVWDPSTTPSSKTYRITITLDSGVPNAKQGASVTAQAFVWEVQS